MSRMDSFGLSNERPKRRMAGSRNQQKKNPLLGGLMGASITRRVNSSVDGES